MLREQVVSWDETGTLASRLRRWALSSSDQSKVVEGELLSRRSSLRIGGAAKAWIEVGTPADLASLLAALGDEPFWCVGLGSNVLFPDEGIEEPVIRLGGELATFAVHPDPAGGRAVVDVMAGAVNAHLVRGLLKAGYVGAEFLRLIPGTFGGAVALNAGTKDAELVQMLETVQLATREREERCWKMTQFTPQELQMKYRHAELPEGALVVGGTIAVEEGDVDEARARVKYDKDRRDRTQPYRLASVGSTFANPPGDYAGRLIEAAGLKGEVVGDAQISPLHANFFINRGEAKAENFLSLMALARHRVREEFGVELTPEVRFVGFDGWARMLDLEEEWKDKDV